MQENEELECLDDELNGKLKYDDEYDGVLDDVGEGGNLEEIPEYDRLE